MLEELGWSIEVYTGMVVAILFLLTLLFVADGKLVGIGIDNATNKVDLPKLILSKLPSKVETAAA